MSESAYSKKYTNVPFSDIPFSEFDDFGLKSSKFESVKKDNKNVKRKVDKKTLVLKIIVFFLLILLLLEGILHTIIIPSLAPVKVQFSGIKNLTVEQLTSKVNEIGSATWIQFDVAKAVSILSEIPSIEKVSVDKQFPDKVFIKVTERIPVARSIVSENGRSISVQIDKNGVLFTGGITLGVNDSNIPLISGLPIDRIQDGMRLPSKYCTLMERIAELSALEQKYFAAVSEIQVVPKDYGNYELILYPIHTHVKVLTDRSLDEEQLKKMMVALDIVNSIEADAGELDLRYGAVSYRRH